MEDCGKFPRVCSCSERNTKLFYFLCELDFLNHSTPHLRWKGLGLGLRTTLKICESWNYTVLKFTRKSAMRSRIFLYLAKFHNHNTIYEYFTDQNNVNIGALLHKKHLNWNILTMEWDRDLKFGMYMLGNKVNKLAQFQVYSAIGV